MIFELKPKPIGLTRDQVWSAWKRIKQGGRGIGYIIQYYFVLTLFAVETLHATSLQRIHHKHVKINSWPEYHQNTDRCQPLYGCINRWLRGIPIRIMWNSGGSLCIQFQEMVYHPGDPSSRCSKGTTAWFLWTE